TEGRAFRENRAAAQKSRRKPQSVAFVAGNLAAHREQRTSRVVVVWIGGRSTLAVHDHTGRDRRPLRPGQPHLALGNAGGGGVVSHGVSFGGDSDRPGIGAQEPLAAPEGNHASVAP